MPRLPWPPVREPIADLRPRVDVAAIVPRAWLDWFQALADRIDRSPPVLQMVRLTGQSAGIAPTPIPVSTLGTGVYRVSVYAHITTPAGTSSRLRVNVYWSDGGVPLIAQGPELTSNTALTFQSWVQTVQHDANAPIRYEVEYSSTGDPAMVYTLVVALEALP